MMNFVAVKAVAAVITKTVHQKSINTRGLLPQKHSIDRVTKTTILAVEAPVEAMIILQMTTTKILP